jgi:hypothetical protein
VQPSLSIRNHFFLCTQPSVHSNYIKQIYLRNKTWRPPPAPNIIEEQITAFEKALKGQQNKLQSRLHAKPFKNLTTLQLSALKSLCSNTAVTIKPTDKNLGPAIMDTTHYVRQVLQEHLLTKDYRQLTAHEAKTNMENLQHTLKNTIESNAHILSKAE